MDKMSLSQMAFYGYHGVFPEENKLGQRFIVDLVLEMDLSIAGKSDELADSINYAEVYESVKKIVEGPPKKLVESVAEAITSDLLTRFSLIEVCHVKVIKPDPPIPGHYQSVAIELSRSRA